MRVCCMCMEFVKYHSLGNDYLVYDPNQNKRALTDKIIRAVCHRQYGLGADGVLLGPFFEDNGISLKIYNADGTEALKSGNGLLIFSKYLKDSGYIQKKEFELHIAGTDEKMRVYYNNELGTNTTISMGRLLFSPEAVGCSYNPCRGGDNELVDIALEFGAYTYRCTCVDIGNPHCVLPFKTVTKAIVCDIGEKIEASAYFTKGINTQIVQIIDRHNIRIEIYERGVGYTLASGTSACAAVGAMYKQRFVDSKVWVHMAGGKVLVEIDDEWRADMTGTVSAVGVMKVGNEFILEKNI